MPSSRSRWPWPATPPLRSTRPWCGSVPTRNRRSGWSTTPAFRPLFRRRRRPRSPRLRRAPVCRCQRAGPGARYLCPVRSGRSEEARAAGPAQAQDCEGRRPMPSQPLRLPSNSHFRLFRRRPEQHLVRLAPPSASDLARQLRDLVGKAVVAGQPLVLFLQETAFIDALGGRRLWLGLRRKDRVVAGQPFLGRVVDVLTRLQLLRDG